MGRLFIARQPRGHLRLIISRRPYQSRNSMAATSIARIASGNHCMILSAIPTNLFQFVPLVFCLA